MVLELVQLEQPTPPKGLGLEPVLLKPTGTIQISNPFKHGERKLLNALMFYSQVDEQLTSTLHDISLESVMDAMGWGDSKNIDELKDYARTLLSEIVEWNEFGVDRRKEWKACQFLSSFAIKGNRVRYRINPEIVAECRQPELYGKIHMLVQTNFTRKYSSVLYEYFQDELGRSPAEVISIDKMPVEQMTHILGVGDSEHYNQYKFLNNGILKPCMKEINKHSDINVDYNAVKKGRYTVGIDIRIMRSDTFQMAFDLDIKRTADNPENTQDALQATLEKNGVTKKVALALVGKYSAERVQNNVNHMEAEIKKGLSIKNRGAWLRKAIQEDWQPKKSAADVEATKKSEEIARKKIEKRRKDEERQQLEKEFEKYQSKTLRIKFGDKSQSFQTRRRNEFIEQMKAEKNTGFLNFYRKGGWENGVVQSMFYTSMVDELLTEAHEKSIDAYAVWEKPAQTA